MKWIMFFIVGFIYNIFVDVLSGVLSSSSYIQIYNNSFSSREWRDILLAITILVIAIIDVIIKLKNRNYRNKMIVMEDRKDKKLNMGIKILIILCCVGSFIYYKSVKTFMWSSILVSFAIIFLSREILEDGIIEEGVMYKGDLIKWEDIISSEWDKSTLKMIILRKYFGLRYKDKITIQVKDDTVWRTYIGSD